MIQYMDDTTLFIEEDLNSFKCAIEIIELLKKKYQVWQKLLQKQNKAWGLKRQRHTLARQVWLYID